MHNRLSHIWAEHEEKQIVIAIVFLCSPVKSQKDFKQTWRGHPDSDVHLLCATDAKLKIKVSPRRPGFALLL